MDLCEDGCVFVENFLQGNYDAKEDELEKLEYFDRWEIVGKFSL